MERHFVSKVRGTVITAAQRRLQSLIQPLVDSHNAFHSDTLRQLDETARYLAEMEKLAGIVHESILFSRWQVTPDVLATRNEAGHWLNSLGLFGDGVEVGVFRGEYSNQLLRTWRCRSLTSIDPWREFPSSEYVDACNTSKTDQEQNYRSTAAALARFGERSKIMRLTSSEAAARFENESLDFAYLDAQHHYEAIKADISLWLPKVTQGGVLGGHDYLEGQLESGLYGVKRAVTELVESTGYRLIVTAEKDWPSWYVIVG
jgi:hypothetical protein